MVKRNSWALVVAAGLLVVSCTSENGTKGESSRAEGARAETGSVSSSLDSPNGGLTRSSETPAFGDAELKAARSFDAASADSDALVGPSPGSALYRFALLWGPQATAERPSAVAPPPTHSWSIQASVRKGVVRLVRTLASPDGQILVKREALNELRFENRTTRGVAGVLLSVEIAAGTDPLLGLHFGAQGQIVNLPVLERVGGGSLVLDDGANALLWSGFRLVEGCEKGFAFGEWGARSATAGMASGQVLDARGARIGWVRGPWGLARGKSDPTYHVKYIDEAGNAVGLSGGSLKAGHFSGAWESGRPAETGWARGVYGNDYPGADARGPWLGSWFDRCPNASPL